MWKIWQNIIISNIYFTKFIVLLMNHQLYLTIHNKQSKIPLTSLEVYTSDQYRIKLSSTGWKYKLPDWSRYLISRTGWKYKLPTSPFFYISKYLVLVGSINFRPVQFFISQNIRYWFKVYTSNQYWIILSGTGWKYKFPPSTRRFD